MSGDSQIDIPPSFMSLYLAPGRTKPSLGWVDMAARYELCEDMANMLTETAKSIGFSTGLPEGDVLLRCLQGLTGPDAGLTAKESRWVVQRLAELLGWPAPELPDAP
jgi:hypothetical protein